MYKFHNNNALGLFENDCTVRAISTATGNSWDDTYKHLSNTARLQGTMMDDKDFIRNYLDAHYDRLYDIPKTVGEVAGAYSFDCRERIAEYCWKIK